MTDAQKALARAVVEELERVVLWRGIVHQRRRIVIDILPPRIEIEPTTAIVSISRWTQADAAEVIPADSYTVASRDPLGTVIVPAPGYDWPAPERSIGSFSINYECGWDVTPESTPGAGDAINNVPSSVQLMVERAISFRAGGGGVGDLKIGSIDLAVPDSYATDRLPAAIASIGRAFAYRPGLFAARP